MDSRRISQEFTPSIIYDDDEDEVIVKAGDRTGDKAHTLIRTEDIIKEDRMPGDKLSEDELSQGRIQWGHESLFPKLCMNEFVHRDAQIVHKDCMCTQT